MEEDDRSNTPCPSPSLENKIKHSICFSCCFGRPNRHHYLPSPPLPSDNNPSLIWVKNQGPHMSEIKDKCRSLLGISGNKHRRLSSAEYSYDPLSYSLNFEDDFDRDDAAPLNNFCARLPSSPPPSVWASSVTAL